MLPWVSRAGRSSSEPAECATLVIDGIAIHFADSQDSAIRVQQLAAAHAVAVELELTSHTSEGAWDAVSAEGRAPICFTLRDLANWFATGIINRSEFVQLRDQLRKHRRAVRNGFDR